MYIRYSDWCSSAFTRNRSLWMALALALVLTALLVAGLVATSATVSASTLAPEDDSASSLVPNSNAGQQATCGDLAYSYKSASQDTLAPGGVLTYTIWLHNSGSTTVTAQVVDPLPPEVNYVAGSVTGGGVYDPASRTISWDDVTVPAGRSTTGGGTGVALSFAVTATVSNPIKVLNTATISGGGESLERSVWVWLIPEQPPHLLDGVKLASQYMLAPDEVLTYTILLYNSGSTTVTADVMDPLPQEVNYVAGSVTGGGVYDAASRTISWDDVSVPPGDVWPCNDRGVPGCGGVVLSFVVTATVDVPTEVVNTAVISADGESFERSVWVQLVPEQPNPRPLTGVKFASQYMLAPDEVLTYTILLYNSGSATVTAQVVDPLPPEVNYVAGSVTGGGVYDAASRTITWDDVPVPPGDVWPCNDRGVPGCGGVMLTFAVTATVDVPTEVVNTAVISADGESFACSVWVQLIPERPTPGHDLAGSRKIASQYMLAPDEVLTYTIWLYNSGAESAIADVTDPLPVELNYVAGSVTGGGVYDASSRTISWDDVTVPADGNPAGNGGNMPDCDGVALSFAVTATVNVPTEVVNTAIISANGKVFERNVWVQLVPERPGPGPRPLDGIKLASQHMLAPDEVLTYTVILYNSGSTTVTADVMDPLPQDVNYVAESVTGDGTYDAASRTIYWSGVAVPPEGEPVGTGVIPGGYVALSFAVTATVNVPTEVLNTAIISAGGQAFERWAWVLLVPERPTPKPDLDGSFKWASHRKLPPGEPLFYAIVLHNSGTGEAVVDVTDPLPAEVNYVPGSAMPDAIYDEGARTLHWSDVDVPAGWGVPLFFSAMPNTVTVPTVVTNTATISADGDSLERHARVLLLPDSPGYDYIPPVVHSLTIDEQDVLNSPTVTLHISATDNVGVRWMYLREWEWAATPWPRWKIVQNSEWVPYQADYPWTLGGESGTHFVGVWVADDAHNISQLDLRGLDFASLVQPGAVVPEFGMMPYLVYYGAGVDVSSVLTPTSTTGYAAMDVWYTGNFFEPIATDTQAVTFTTPSTGTYVFVVHGEPGATYDLSIEPGGGPRLPLFDVWATGGRPLYISADSQAASGGTSDLVSMLTESGLDPLGVVNAPSAIFRVYLPIVLK